MRNTVFYICYATDGWTFHCLSLEHVIRYDDDQMPLYRNEQFRIFYGPYPWTEDK